MTPDEIRAAILADPALVALAHADPPDTQGIAAALSVGRFRLVPTEIGAGTIVAALRGHGAGGGVFLDTLVAIGAVDRDVFWTMDLIKQGRCRIDLAATRDGLTALATAQPQLASSVAELLKLGKAPDPINDISVRRAILADNGDRLV